MEALGEFWDFVTTAENWWGNRGILLRVYDHLRLSGFSLLLAAVIALPPAIALGHVKRGGVAAVWLVNIGRAVPSFALIVLIFPFSLRYGFGLGFWPTAFALVLLAIPPIFTNAFTGVRDVDVGTVEAARGMGMQGREVVWGVEIPAALPLIVTGLRVSAVQVVATATLGAYVGFGGLGAFIVEGFATRNDGKILTGAILVAALSLIVELGFGALQKALTPWTRVGLLVKRDAMVDSTVLEVDPAAA
ncbi:MAG TPA: ABC transporter permease [Acidimicrobiales bacterium]|nr:ABC transporter permease [Acidimicrobiales bacterium]